MATTQPAVKLTYEDYRTTPADKRYELLDGELLIFPDMEPDPDDVFPP